MMFNSLLIDAGLQLKDVRLLRHKDPRADRSRTPYELWRYDRPKFEFYQSTQSIENAAKLRGKYWAAFLGTPANETLFVGIYRAENKRLLKKDLPKPHMDGVDKAGSCHLYDLTLEGYLIELIGRLVIDWKKGRSWIQRADRQNKAIIELREVFREPDFPGFLHFIKSLSELNALPKSWITALRATKGVYLLTCPKTKEQYVGSATGENGFWSRWQEYLKTGHGGNVVLKSRKQSDYQVSILEVAGTAALHEDILKMESHWKAKLQTREMGLNGN